MCSKPTFLPPEAIVKLGTRAESFGLLLNLGKRDLILSIDTVELSGSNTDGSFAMAVSNSFLCPLEQKLIAADLR